VKTLLNEQVKAGTNSIIWKGDNDRGQTVASGVYFYEARGAGSEVLQKVTLVK